jgi:hypothetical protein
VHRLCWISLLSIACAQGEVGSDHPLDGTQHFPEGLCAVGDQIFSISSNHDRRYLAGALTAWNASGNSLTVAGRSTAGASEGALAPLPAGFGTVLHLASCDPGGAIALVDRVGRTLLRLAVTDGLPVCTDDGCAPIALGGEEAGELTGQLDPGHAVAAGDFLLVGSRVAEAARLVAPDGTVTEVGPAMTTRPVRGAPILLPYYGVTALHLDDAGAITELALVGFDGARWAVADPADSTRGLALHRTGNLLIAFERVGDNLVVRWRQPLIGARRRLVRTGNRLWAFGSADRSIERRNAETGALEAVYRDPLLDNVEGLVDLGDRLLLTAFEGHQLLTLDLATGVAVEVSQ